MDILFLVGRILFGGFFLLSGVNHFLELNSMEKYAAAKKLPLPRLAVIGTGLLLVLGGISILVGAWPRLGALLLMIFLLPTSFIMHDFWNDSDPQSRQANQINFMKNIALSGACLVFLAIDRWPLALVP